MFHSEGPFRWFLPFQARAKRTEEEKPKPWGIGENTAVGKKFGETSQDAFAREGTDEDDILFGAARLFATPKQKREAAERAAALAEEAAGPKPPPAPDITDELVAKARRRQAYRLMSSQGQASTFLTGPFGSFSSTRAGY